MREPDGDQVQDDQPELPISEHPNYVTAYGLQQLKDRRTRLLTKKKALGRDEDDMSSKVVVGQIERELRYVNARIRSAILVTIQAHDTDRVAIGATVRVVDENSKAYRFTIVGEDEADISEGKISWVSPLAKVLVGKKVGDRVIWKRPIGDLSVEIEEITYR